MEPFGCRGCQRPMPGSPQGENGKLPSVSNTARARGEGQADVRRAEGNPVADPRYDQAKAFHQNGSPAEASTLLTELLAEHPGDIGARYALAVCQLDLGLRAQARANLRQVIEDHPGHHAAEYLLA